MLKACFAMRLVLMVLLLAVVSGCASPHTQPLDNPETSTTPDLASLPLPPEPIVASVYDFPDKTGQHRETGSGQAHYSRAVSQGGAAILIRALQDAGHGKWFRVLERNRLSSVLTERQIIREQRQGFLDAEGNPLPPPSPLLYAGVIFEGGIIGYDTNTLTGGAGARFLGIGASTQYREDVVTVFLRAVNSQTGEIWNSVVASKRIYSVQAQGDVFRFVSSDEILELEAGFTRNEPRLVALRQAVEQAVYSMVMEGSELGLWEFADAQQGAQALSSYRGQQRSGAASSSSLPSPEHEHVRNDPLEAARSSSGPSSTRDEVVSPRVGANKPYDRGEEERPLIEPGKASVGLLRAPQIQDIEG